MTEAEWHSCAGHTKIMSYLRGRASNRKLRLFAVACCRQVWDLIDESIHKAAEVAESFADGLASDQELAAVREACWHWGSLVACADAWIAADEVVVFTIARFYRTHQDDPFHPVMSSFLEFRDALVQDVFGPLADLNASQTCETQFGKSVVHRITEFVLGKKIKMGGPSTVSPTINPAWLTWHDSLIPQMAQHIYEERKFEDLPILSDALIDAGCTNQDIIDHCRAPGPHVRGCWVVDLLTGRT